MSDERFKTGAAAYAQYLQTTEGRLRLDLAWANLRACFSEQNFDLNQEKRALDVGGGTGALAVRLAREDWRVEIVDSSAQMIETARDGAREADVTNRISFHHAEAESVASLFAPHTFQLAVCHNVIEYVADPRALLRSLRQIVSHDGLLSIVTRNRAGEALRAAIKTRDIETAERMLTAERARESLYGGEVRLFDFETLRRMLRESGFQIIAERGVRVVADYMPSDFAPDDAAYAQLLAFEERCGAMPDFASVARYAQTIARGNS